MVKDIAKSHGVLMSGEMVRAWLAGQKNQTRRTRGLDKINQNPDEWKFSGWFHHQALFEHLGNVLGEAVKVPYGFVGDALYFKETWKMWEEPELGKDYLHFRADDAKVDPAWWTEEDWRAQNPMWCPKNVFHKWQSSMMMPKMCARIHVPITGVRVERLQDISVGDVVAEGIAPHTLAKGILSEDAPDPRWKYFELWDKLNGKKMPFIMNPFVWVYEFERNKISKKTEV